MQFDYTLLAKFIFGEITPEESDTLMTWMRQSSENGEIYRQAMELKISQQYEAVNNPEAIQAAWEKIRKQTIDKRAVSMKRFRSALRYAAIFIGVVGLSLLGMHYIGQRNSYLTITLADNADNRKITLADSSRIWLKAGTTLRIPKAFSKERRSVYIDGEGYFEVKHDSLSPFTVETEALQIKVLGTSFNVRTRLPEGEVETILVSGKVALEDPDNRPLLEMLPGDKVIYEPEKQKLSVDNIDTNIATAWHINLKKYENATLREIANSMAILYGVNINLPSKEMADRRYRFVINKDESLKQALEILCFTSGTRYRIEGNEIFIDE